MSSGRFRYRALGRRTMAARAVAGPRHGGPPSAEQMGGGHGNWSRDASAKQED